MKKIMFAQAQYLRKREFTILTELIEEDGKEYVSKKAVYPEANSHIKSVYENYLLLKNSKNTFKLPKTNLVEGSLISEYIDNPNLAAEIETLLIEGRREKANEKVVEFIDYLNTVPTVKENPYNSETFVDLFDPDKKHDPGKNVECWYPGFHDINFDNFIREDGEYYFIDFEWCFDFPLPKDFLILRAIFFLSLRLKRIIKTMVSADFPCVNYYNDVLTPLSWLERVEHSEQIFQQMLDYEHSLFSKKIKHYDPLEPVKKDYMKNIVDVPYSEKQPKSVLLEAKITDLTNSLNQLRAEFESERSIRIQKEIEVSSLTGTIDKLTTTNLKYQTRSFQLLEKLESTKIAQFKPLRIFLRKTITFMIRVGNLLK